MRLRVLRPVEAEELRCAFDGKLQLHAIEIGHIKFALDYFNAWTATQAPDATYKFDDF